MEILFTLQSQFVGTIADNFTISGTTSENVTYLLASNISLSNLISGYIINTNYTNITGGTICSTGFCTNCVPWSLNLPVTTSTPTPTATTIVDNAPTSTPTSTPTPTPTPTATTIVDNVPTSTPTPTSTTIIVNNTFCYYSIFDNGTNFDNVSVEYTDITQGFIRVSVASLEANIYSDTQQSFVLCSSTTPNYVVNNEAVADYNGLSFITDNAVCDINTPCSAPTAPPLPTATPTPSPSPSMIIQSIEWGISTTEWPTSLEACQTIDASTPIYAISGTSINTGTQLYANTNLTLNYVPSSTTNWYLIVDDLTNRYAVQIDNLGIISSLNPC